MKKLSLVIIILIVLTGCSNGLPSDSSASAGNVTASLSSVPLIKEKDYEVYDLSMNNRPVYQYYIFKNGDDPWPDILDYGVIYAYPEITYTNGLLKMSLRIESDVVDICKYFDIDNNLASIWFISPAAENGKLVAYPDQPSNAKKLIVQDIFDKSGYYLEIERDFANAPWLPAWPEFIDNGRKLKLIYEAEDHTYKTEIIDLE